jgi:hypothetical protein
LAELVPVDHDPFGGPKTVPVDYDPFASEKFVNPAVKGMIGGMASLPRRAIESAATYEQTGFYDPAPIIEAATLPMGGSPFAVRGALGAAGGKLVMKRVEHDPFAWKGYHGTAAEEDFGVNFDLGKGPNKSEEGVAFFGPTPHLANTFSSSNRALAARVSEASEKSVAHAQEMRAKYGTTQWEARASQQDLAQRYKLEQDIEAAYELPEGAAGERIIPVKIKPGKTKTFDVANMFGNDEEFHSVLREVNTNPELGAAPPIFKTYSKEQREALWDRQIDNYREQFKYHEEQRAQILKETKNKKEYPDGPVDIGPWKVPLGTNAIAAAIQIAKKKGLDTARIINLAEGDEQIMVFNKNNIRSALSDVARKYALAGIALPPAIAAAYEQQFKPVDHDPFGER